ncbi:hypothetical protein [Nostoc sp. ATCC 53789]|uniref:hypothetical protein n=1 Tax=Nostoc sp. ATCC 53789 TaxID=76335 RepID=UPI000DEC2CD7|nr:hypothetical protein [Nostoc sp. ATCC 53789]QHG21231.1 hypothetical protein GJB62_35875 [Nostoc sp. ATCC 53789]RCJ16909.1 hypothetical protein A6V25_29950 [Nostoc sp. ATCC 53789]
MSDKFTNNVRARLYKQGYQGFTKDDYTSAAIAVECDDLDNPTKDQLSQAVDYLKVKSTSQLSVVDEPVEETFLVGSEDAQPEVESNQLTVAESENQIVPTEQEKQALVADIAQGAGIELKAADVKQITVSIASTFASRKELNEAIFNALVHFAREFKNQEVSKIRRKADEIRQTLAEMDDVAGSELTQIKQAMEATALDYKSQFADLALSFAGIID